MPNPPDSPPDWSQRIRGIAEDWLFSDVPETALPETFILPLENPDLYDRDVWAAHLDVEWKSRCVTVGTHRDRPVGVMAPKFGAPAAALAVDLLAGRGVREILGIGFCGGIAPALRCGELFLAEAAVSSDGTCPTYVPERYPAVADAALVSRLSAAGPAAHRGLVWSVDGILTQDSAFVVRAGALGVAAVDMETAAVLTVARLRGVRAVTLLVVSDHPGRGECADGAALIAGVGAATEAVLAAVAGPGA